jgi:hypothetical protein
MSFETAAAQFSAKVQQATTPAQRDECFALLRDLKVFCRQHCCLSPFAHNGSSPQLTMANMSHVTATTRDYTVQQKKEIEIARELKSFFFFFFFFSQQQQQRRRLGIRHVVER